MLRKYLHHFSASFLLVIFVLAGCGGGQKTDIEYVASAKAHIDNNKINEASIELKNALQVNPNNSEARWVLGKLYTDLGSGAAAEKELEQAIKLGIPASQINANLAKALFLQGKNDELLEHITVDEQYSKQDKLMVIAYRIRAYINRGQLNLAEEALQEAFGVDENSDVVLLSSAYLDIARNDLNLALSALDQATSVNPKNVEAWIVKGDVYNALRQKEKTFESYNSVLKINPNHFGVQTSIASAHIAYGEIEEADKIVDQALGRAPKDVNLIYLRSVIRFMQGNYQAARDGAIQVLKIVPEHAPSMILNGATQLALGSFELANDVLSKVVSQYPGSVYARKLLAATALNLGQPQRALDMINPIQQFAEEDPSIFGLFGETYLKLGKPDLAISYFEKATSVEPQRGRWLTQLGRSRIATGDVTGGIRDLEFASHKIEDQYQAETLLILTHMREKNFDKAYEITSQLEKKLKNSPVPFAFRGAIYEAKQDFANARQSYEKALTIAPSLFSATSSLARLDMKEHKKADAKARFEKLLDLDASETRAMMALADLEMQDGNEEEYISWLEKIINNQSVDIVAYMKLAQFYLRKQDVRKALSVSRDAVAKVPSAAESYLILARAQLANKEIENAILNYNQVLSINGGKDPRVYLELSNAQLLAGNVAVAKDLLNRALTEHPNFLAAKSAMTLLLIREGKGEKALQMAKSIQKKYPELSMGYVLAADMFLASGKFDQAERNYRIAYSLQKDRAIALSWSKSLVALKRPADVPLKDWLTENSEDELAKILLASIYRDEGSFDKAFTSFNSILEKSPENALALNELALTYYQANKRREAVNTAQKAYEISQAPAIADTYAWMLQAEGAVDRALEVYKEVITSGTQNPEIRFHYAYVLHKSGKSVEAKSELQKILQSGVKFTKRAEAEKLFAQL